MRLLLVVIGILLTVGNVEAAAFTNYFDDIINIGSSGADINTWNAAKQTGTKYIGSSYLGDSFRSSPSGSGISQKITLNTDNMVYSPQNYELSYPLSTNNACAVQCHNYIKRLDKNIDYYPNIMTTFDRYETYLGILNQMRDTPMNITDPTIDFYYYPAELYGNSYDYFRKVQPSILKEGYAFFEFEDMTLSNGNGTFGINVGDRTDVPGFSVQRDVENGGAITKDGYFNTTVSAVLYENVDGFISLSQGLGNSSEFNAWLVNWSTSEPVDYSDIRSDNINVNFNTQNDILPKRYNLTATFYVDKLIPANITLKPWVSVITRKNLQTVGNYGSSITINGTKFNMDSTFRSSNNDLIWTAQEAFEKRLELDGGLVDILDPVAEFSFNKDFIAGTDSDSLDNGMHKFDQWYSIDINNRDDKSNTVLGDLNFSVRSENITDAAWREYAIWNATSINWEFPSNYFITENSGFGTGFSTGYSESRLLNMSVERWMNQTVFYNSGYQLVNFNVTFNKTNFDWAWVRMDANSRHEVDASIVRGTFNHDVPNGWIDENEHGINFGFDKASISPGTTYHFSVIVKVTLTGREAPAILYKPGITVARGFYYNTTVANGHSVEIPPSMLPENVSHVSASTNVSNAWIIKRHNHSMAVLWEISKIIGPHARLSFNKDLGVRTDDDSMTSGWYDARVGYWMNIHNNDDDSDTVLGDVRMNVQAENITNIDWQLYAAWNSTSVNWMFPTSFSISENSDLGAGFRTKYFESKYLGINLNRWMNQTTFSSDGYQRANFSIEFVDMNFEWLWININVYDRYGVKANVVPGSFSYNAPVDWFNEGAQRIQINLNMNRLQPGVIYNFSAVIKIEPTGEKDTIVYKPEFEVGQGIYYDSANGGNGYSVEVPSSMLPEHVSNVSAATNTSNAWLVERGDNIIARLVGEDITPPVISDFKVEPNTSISPTNPADISSSVFDENLMQVLIGVVDSSDLIDTNRTVIGIIINASGTSGKYTTPPWNAQAMMISSGTIQDIVTAILISDLPDHMLVPGSFKKNATSNEELAFLMFNMTTGNISNITMMNSPSEPDIENGISTFKILKLKFSNGMENPWELVEGKAFTLFSIGNLNNPLLSSSEVPSGRYKVFIFANDDAGNNNAEFMDVDVSTFRPRVLFDTAKANIAQNLTKKMNIILDQAPSGLSGYNITISLSNGTVAEIISVDLPGWATLNSSGPLPGDSVWFKVSDLSNLIQSGATNVDLATLTLRGDSIGNADIFINVSGMDDDIGSQIDPATVASQVDISAVLPFSCTECKTPTDPDGDGLFEDINGNGKKDFNDVVVFFNYLEWVASNQSIQDFDFNGNGRIDFNDIVKLFEKL